MTSTVMLAAGAAVAVLAGLGCSAGAPDVCTQVSSWHGTGVANIHRVDKALFTLGESLKAGQVAVAEGPDARRLLAAAATALGDPPPGASRHEYIAPMTHVKTGALQVQAGHLTAAATALAAYGSAIKRAGLLVNRQCG